MFGTSVETSFNTMYLELPVLVRYDIEMSTSPMTPSCSPARPPGS
ncbi:MAG TPA: hypothetical protein VF212_05965 [Longimicrobiales bacterium]